VARWTFDPLVARNAWLNLGKLGAVADRFERAFYGEMTDEINRGDRTDRLVIRWDLDRDPIPRAAESEGLPTVLEAQGHQDAPQARGDVLHWALISALAWTIRAAHHRRAAARPII